MATMKENGSTRIQSVLRAAQALTLIASLAEEERTIANIAKHLGTTKATTYHLLNTLVDAKYLSRDAAKRYQFGLGVGVLAAAYEKQTSQPFELILPLRWLADVTGETAYFGVWRDGNIEISARATGHLAVQVANLQPGFHSDAHARASGKVLLAYVEENMRQRYLATHPLRACTPHTITDLSRLMIELNLVRSQGYGTEVEEFAEGVACMAVPLMAHGHLIGAYTVSVPIERYRSQQAFYLDNLRTAAQQAESDVGSLEEPDTVAAN
jgi:IclR family transcriptional regulator, acetate operon repressor